MLAKYFEMFEPTERQITAKALRRLKIAAMVALAAVPLIVVDKLIPLETMHPVAATIIEAAFIISVIGFLFICCSRVFNRVWAPDKYLDESEILRKRESATFAYMVLGWGAGTIIISTVFAIIFINSFSLESISSDLIVFLFGSLIYTAFVLQAIKLVEITPAYEDPESDGMPHAKDKAYKNSFLFIFLIFIFLVFAVPFTKGIVDGVRAGIAEAECGQTVTKSNCTK